MDILNREQKKASAPDKGISLIIAGAGAGKTKTLISKVNNVLLNKIARAEEIVILTFSRKAAAEIRERIESAVGPECGSIFAGTFHSFAYHLLRKYRTAFMDLSGYSRFPQLLTDEIRENFFRDIISSRIDRFLGLPAAAVFELYTSLPDLNLQRWKTPDIEKIVSELNYLHVKFDDFKKQNNIIEYEEMIDYTIALLDKEIKISESVRGSIKYLFIDEFQDTSDNNFNLIKRLLCPDEGALFAVGDDWQSIYAFRKANIDYILRFRKYFPGAKIHKLVINYRSRREIVKISSRFIRINRKRTGKKLRSASGGGGNVRLYECGGFTEEKSYIIHLLNKHLKKFNDIAVIYRNNWQGKIIRDHLNNEGFEHIKTMTIHGSKGLEFDAVIIAGISDTVIPNRNTDIEEERRLFYVAMTRARMELHIISHRNESGARARFAAELRIKPSSDAPDPGCPQS